MSPRIYMLDTETLSQLSQLKSDILASKEFANGRVVGTNGRFGFVRTDDGRDAFLPPEKMDKLLPGDIVRVSLIINKQNKLEANLEELIESPTDRFIGTYRCKGKAHFVEPSIDGFKRWIFLPPQARARCKEGDLLVAKMIQHPLKDGKAQAKVLERIGREDDDRIEFKYTRAKYDLNHEFSQKEKDQINEIEQKLCAPDTIKREDLTHLPFVTIDSATTRDMDDAVYTEVTDNGYMLYVAIADPASSIEQGSPLAIAAQERVQTVYMLGGVTPMLPQELSNQYFSLEEGKQKHTLVCKIQINQEGTITHYHFSHATIQSKYKLNYDDVAEFIEDKNNNAIPADIHTLINQLHEVATYRNTYRKKHNTLHVDHCDFDYQLTASGKIESIKPKPKNAAHRLIEEAMVSINVCAGELLAQDKLGIAIINEGFRKDRLGEVKALFKEEKIEPSEDIETLEGFMKCITNLQNSDDHAYLVNPLKRMTEMGHPALDHKPHMGMGLQHYATISSPIRRFVDLYNHWAIKNILLGNSLKKLSNKNVHVINEKIQVIKKAERELYQWLISQYTESLIGSEANGRIRIVTQQGFGVRIDENGIEGFVLFPKKKEKKFDAKRMTLNIDNHQYRLEENIKIKISKIDKTKRRIAFEII